MPGYFRFLTVLAFHAFLSENVDATILEVGVGGTYDSTNIVPRPVATGVTALGLDHVSVLGKTLKEIAWHKGGIYKAGVPAFTVEQPAEALEVLEQRAAGLKVSQLSVVPLNTTISHVQLGLSGTHQYQNASLAIALAGTVLRDENSKDTIPESYVSGLKDARWPGRCQTVLDSRFPRITWYLDGAHTSESMEYCLQWFVSSDVGLFDRSDSGGLRILLFNCTQGRSGASLLRTVLETASKRLSVLGENNSGDLFFDHVIFCTNVTYADGHSKGDLTTVAMPTTLAVQYQLASSWSSLLPSFPPSHIHVSPTIEDAAQLVRSISTHPKGSIKVLVTGSLHLIGGLIEAAGLAGQAL